MMRRRDLPGVLAPVQAGCSGSSAETIRIAVSTGLVEPYLAYLADALGYFREEGTAVAFQEFAGSRQVESLLGGTTDAVYNSFSAILMLGDEARLLRSFFVGLETFSAMLDKRSLNN
jgi:ABC-type nitrate/sulfonate/bicarbonate transport system substrate-binding protein